MKLNISSIITKLKPLNPHRVILFGSYAKGNAKTDSDIDLLIIKNTNKRPVDRIKEVLNLTWGYSPRIEPQVLTPKEFDNAIKQKHYFITEEVLKYGKTIYEPQI